MNSNISLEETLNRADSDVREMMKTKGVKLPLETIDVKVDKADGHTYHTNSDKMREEYMLYCERDGKMLITKSATIYINREKMEGEYKELSSKMPELTIDSYATVQLARTYGELIVTNMKVPADRPKISDHFREAFGIFFAEFLTDYELFKKVSFQEREPAQEYKIMNELNGARRDDGKPLTKKDKAILTLFTLKQLEDYIDKNPVKEKVTPHYRRLTKAAEEHGAKYVIEHWTDFMGTKK